MNFFRRKNFNTLKNVLITFFIIFCFGYFAQNVNGTPEDDAIGKWAEKIGSELWELGKRMTKSPEIKAKYKEYNARVEIKDGPALLKSIVENVSRMLSRKMDAIKCILDKAEIVAEDFEYNATLAENFTYYSSKYSLVNDTPAIELVPSIQSNAPMYLNMSLDEDTHFYNIPVNTAYSTAHVPSNIYDKSPTALETLMWTEALDEVFIDNYNRDPALSWQYFCSDTGIMRHYPAIQWRQKGEVDVYDCRKRSWYIETATCSKDIVILLDNSGSMTGFRNHIAKLTVSSILNTFSNNDFINIFNYSNTVDDLIPCFNNSLVQATPENIKVFTDAIEELSPEGYANVSGAYEKAFDLLEQYRILRRCNESSTGCNQAIMLITDGVAGNTTEIFEEYNWVDAGNSTKIPVRIFTYLLGKEVTKVREIQWMACLNRGYYSHIQTLDEVQEEVLKYVTVIATPLVLQSVEHPPTWTHAFTDQTATENEKTRLMIAVGVPAYDRKMYHRNATKRARLLGVAGTDIPVDELDDLTLPYKLGVNGYSFIVSNNGYVLLHPDLRAKDDDRLKRNYNSIDFTEVEQINDDNPVRQPGDLLLDIRMNLASHKFGNISNVPVKFHYDKMRRVSPELQDYYYAPLPNTPFSLGLVLPSTYGNTWIKVGDEVKRNRHMNIDISNYFIGENWKIHPDWIYCKYHYLEGHEFDTPEEEWRHFLKKLNRPDFKWAEQYEPDPISNDINEEESEESNCKGQTLDIDDYYCNKELVQLLIFDAKVTNTSFQTWYFANEYERNLIEKKYNATLRFVATMSGLTRWQFIFGEVEVETDEEFGDVHKMAIDETWYKSAILQHRTDSESFVYTVPHASDMPEDGNIQVTASHAIFPVDGYNKAPGCVVGFQFSHALMRERFLNITSEENCNGCVKTCNSDENDCYIIDNNGYVIISEEANDTGRFFGEITGAGAVMESMVESNIFKNITVYDLQGSCSRRELVSNDGNINLNPIKLLGFGINWLFTELIWYLSRINMWVKGDPFYDDSDVVYDTATVKPFVSTTGQRKGQYDEEEEYFNRVIIPEYETTYFSCDKQSNLYVLQQDLFINGTDFNSEVPSNCSYPYHVKRIPKSNLLLVVIKTMIRQSCVRQLTTEPQVIHYDPIIFPCYKLNLNYLYRRRLDECFTEHPNEAEYSYCGDANFIYLKYTTAIISAIIFVCSRYSQQFIFY